MTTAGPANPLYTDALAVAAVRAAAGYTPDAFFTPVVMAGATRPTATSYHLVTTPALEGGLYDLSLAMFVTGSSSGTDVGMDVELDGVGLGDVLSEAAVVGGGFLLSVGIAQAWAPGVHTIEYFGWQPTSPGTLTARLASTTYERKA